MENTHSIDGYRLVDMYFNCIAGRQECNADAEAIIETLSKEEQKKVISDAFMAVMCKAHELTREADKKACPFLTKTDTPQCQRL